MNRSEEDEAADASTFDMGKVAGKSEVEAEVRSSGNRTTLFLVLIVGALSVSLVACVGVSVLAYSLLAARKTPVAPEAEQQKTLEPAKETKARIKEIDLGQKTIRLLIGRGRTQVYQVSGQTEFFDVSGKRLTQGITAPELRLDEDCIILPTADHEGLQWLKLTAEK